MGKTTPIDLNVRLSPHFTLYELCRSATAERAGIANVPPKVTIKRLELVCVNLLEKVRDHFGIPLCPSSGYRSRRVNALVGSTPSSQHLKGEAVDFEISGVYNAEVAIWIRDNLDFDQLILECYTVGIQNSGWLHCSYKKKGNRRECLTFTTDKKKLDGIITG